MLLRPVPIWNETIHLFGEAGSHYPWHICPGTGLWKPGRVCGGCRKEDPCGCLSPAPMGNHRGIDFHAPEITVFTAVVDGKIVRAGRSAIDDHDVGDTFRIVQEVRYPGMDSWKITYRNLSRIFAWDGAVVKAGEPLGMTALDYLHVELADPMGQYRPMDFKVN